jgi:putative transposase
MPRSRRRLIAGGIYHVTCRGNRKEPIFLSDGDRILFLELVKKVTAHRRWLIHSYCLMQNHYHLLLETPEPDLSAGMQTINSEYAQWFNRGYGFVGHVFQGRFHAVLVESDWHLLELTRYIAMNPVRAGLCLSPAEWRWSSFCDVMGGPGSSLHSPDRVLAFFGADEDRARQAFGRFVDEARAE